MRIEDYRTSSGKNVITEYIYSLPQKDRAKALKIRSDLRERGLDALNELNTRRYMDDYMKSSYLSTDICMFP